MIEHSSHYYASYHAITESLLFRSVFVLNHRVNFVIFACSASPQAWTEMAVSRAKLPDTFVAAACRMRIFSNVLVSLPMCEFQNLAQGPSFRTCAVPGTNYRLDRFVSSSVHTRAYTVRAVFYTSQKWFFSPHHCEPFLNSVTYDTSCPVRHQSMSCHATYRFICVVVSVWCLLETKYCYRYCARSCGFNRSSTV